MERRSVYKSFQIVGILFFILFFTSISVLTLQAQTTQKEEEIDITALSRKIEQLDERDYPDFASIFQKLVSMQFTEAAQEIGQWMTGAVLQEIFSSKIFIGELAGILLFASVFSNISSAFQSYGVSDSGFLISYFLVFSIIFTNFTVMIAMFKDTVVLLSGNLSTGIVFYEYFMIVVLFLNWIFLNVFLPLLQYYFLLELISHFSQKQNISKLCEGLYFLLAKGIQVIFFLLFGFHLLETMIAPSFDGAKNSILNKMIGLIPGAGSIVQSVAGTAIGSSLVIKNAVGAAGILFLLIFLLLPLVKLFIYIFLYFLLSVVLEPIADERFILCINAAVKCGILMIKVLCMSSVLFIVVIALTSLTTNYTG